MTAFVSIPNSDVDPESPFTTSLTVALRDNPIAISEGDATAPRIAHKSLAEFTVGNVIVAASSTAATTNSGAYIKLKEFSVPLAGDLRISFSLNNDSGALSYARIYKNGVAIGTERSTSSSSFVSYSEDIVGWSAGDLIQIYCRVSFSSILTVQDVRISAESSVGFAVTLE